MKLFLRKLIVFLLPVFAVFFLPVFAIVKSGETADVNTLFFKQQATKNGLVGLAFSYPVEPYKLEGVKQIKPAVLVLGSSRVMQIRQYFFTANNSFYNTGGYASSVNSLLCFLNNLPAGYNPKVLVVGLDHYWFNARFDTVSALTGCAIQYQPPGLFSLVKYKFTDIYNDVRKGQIRPAALFNNENLGLSAQMNHEGFRKDGSYRYGMLLTNPEKDADYGFKDTYKRIQNNTGRFEYGTDVNPRAMAALNNFLARCASRHIKIVGFLPPYPHAIIDTMRKMGDKYSYINKLQPALKPFFDKYNFELYDYTDACTLGAGSGEYMDGFHVSEKAMLRMVIDINRKGQTLRPYCDTIQLKKLLANAKNDRQVGDD